MLLGPGPPPATTLSSNRLLQGLTMTGSGAGAESTQGYKKLKTGHTPTRIKRAFDGEYDAATAGPVQKQLPPLQPQTGVNAVGAAPQVAGHLEGSGSGALTGAGTTAILERVQRGKTDTQVRIPGIVSRAQDDNYCSDLN